MQLMRIASSSSGGTGETSVRNCQPMSCILFSRTRTKPLSASITARRTLPVCGAGDVPAVRPISSIRFAVYSPGRRANHPLQVIHNSFRTVRFSRATRAPIAFTTCSHGGHREVTRALPLSRRLVIRVEATSSFEVLNVGLLEVRPDEFLALADGHRLDLTRLQLS